MARATLSGGIGSLWLDGVGSTIGADAGSGEDAFVGSASYDISSPTIAGSFAPAAIGTAPLIGWADFDGNPLAPFAGVAFAFAPGFLAEPGALAAPAGTMDGAARPQSGAPASVAGSSPAAAAPVLNAAADLVAGGAAAATVQPRITIFDVIPVGDSSETGQNAEPSIAVDPLDPNDIIVGTFGSGGGTPYFMTTDGGKTWTDYANLTTSDKSVAWLADGSGFVTATLTPRSRASTDITTYSGTVSSSGFGTAINTFEPKLRDSLDQPWVRTGPSDEVYVAYNNLNNAGTAAGRGMTASVNVSNNGGTTFTPIVIERVAAGAGQDAPTVRLAVNGNTVYAAFTRWTSLLDTDSSGEERFNTQVVVVRSDNAGVDSFTALGSGGTGVAVAAPTGLFANTINAPLTLGQERTSSDVAIAVDPNNASRVVIAYSDAPGATGSGQEQLVVAELTDGGNTWVTQFTTSSADRANQAALAILADGTIGLLYDAYTPGGASPDADGTLSQHFVETSDDFATTTDTQLASETNTTPSASFSPYLGDFFDLEAVGDTFYGVFSASNNDNGTGANFANVTFQRDFTGTPGTASFQLTDGTAAVLPSIDPFVFTVVEQTGTIYNGSTSGIVLKTPATQNPATLATGGYVTNNTGSYGGDAVFGTTAAAWTFSNFGTIKATNAASAGIDLQAGGTVTDAAGGSIAGVLDGVAIFGGAGSVTNDGTIRGTGATGIGVYLAKGGAVVNGATNATTALISGAHVGVSISGATAGTVGNYGTIQGTAAYSYGLYLATGATVNNASSGLISGRLAGISTVGAATSTIANSGTIRGVEAGSAGVELNAAATVTNAAGARISGALFGVFVGANGDTISNSGTIQATNTYGDGLYLNAAAQVSNASSGLIVGHHDGVVMLGTDASTVSNLGTIAASGGGSDSLFGVYMQGPGSVINGATNGTTAVIYGPAVGLYMKQVSGIVAVTNFGTIAGGGLGNLGVNDAPKGIYMLGRGTVVNGAPGSPTALIAGAKYGLVMANAFANTVSNFGTIAATATLDAGLYVYPAGLTMTRGTVINGATNATAALIAGANDGIRITGTAASTVSNFGTILGTSTLGGGIYMAGDGYVRNQLGGLISGAFNGVEISGYLASTVANYGTIGGGNGVEMDAPAGLVANFATILGLAYDGIGMRGGAVVNGASALIAGIGHGAEIGGSVGATVTNFGTIVATGTYGRGVYLSGGGGVRNASSGLISGAFNGVEISGYLTSTVTNYGLINSGGVGIQMYGPAGLVANFATIAGLASDGIEMRGGAVVNGAANAASALISGVRQGIGIAGTEASSVSNFGTIEATGSYGEGIYLYGGGNVDNANGGLITGVEFGVRILGALAAGTVSNYGMVSGGDGVDIEAAAGLVANFATIAGLAGDGIYMSAGSVINGAANAASALIAGVGSGVQIGGSLASTVSNFGTIEASGGYAQGIFLAGGGTVRNNQGGLISGDFSGVQIKGTLAGTVTNYGRISGGIDGIDIFGPAGFVSNFATVTGLTNAGIYISAGAVVNGGGGATSALISGSAEGIFIGGSNSTVTNSGTIAGTGAQSQGVFFYANGLVVNNLTGVITGIQDGVFMLAGGGTVSNFGTIRGTSRLGVGIDLAGGGTVINDQSGLITAAAIGIGIGGSVQSSGTVVNDGTIRATSALGVGIDMYTGIVFNDPNGLIRGVFVGIKVQNGSGTVINSGAIEGTGTFSGGVYLLAGGSVVNNPSATIAGSVYGILIGSAASTVVNYGNVAATDRYGVGVDLRVGTVSNFGTVVAGAYGIGIEVTLGNVSNFGTVIAPAADAVIVRYGTFINYGLVVGHVSGIVLAPGTSASGNGMVSVSGTVVGATGITAASTAGSTQTLTVAGTVIGTSGTAVSLTPGGGDRLILDTGAAFEGAVDGGGGASVLEVAGPAAAALAELAAGANVYVSLGGVANFTSLQIDAGAAADASGVLSFATLVNQGLVTVAAGDALGLGVVASAANVGVIALHPGGLVRFAGAVAAQSIVFGPPGGAAAIDQPGEFAASLAGFAAGDTIDLELGTATGAHYTGGVLSLFYNGNPVSLTVTTPYAAPVFVLSADGQGGTDITVRPAAVPRDFDASGTSDLLWQNDNGTVAIWEMDGTNIQNLASDSVIAVDPSWHIAGTGDFNGDGTSDMLWQNDNGTVAIWEMNGTSILNLASDAVIAIDPSWHIAGTGDFNGDGKSDMLWQNDNGTVAIWEMNGTNIQNLASDAVIAVDPNWHIRGTGDFNGDGTSDMLWQNDNGTVAIWEMNGTSILNLASDAASGADPSWHIRGTGDFNGDGTSDILWQNDNGAVAVWEMNGTSILNLASDFVISVDPSWHIRGTGDYNGDGKSDMLWQNDNGAVAIWEMNGTSILNLASDAVIAVDPSWHIIPPDNTGDTTTAAASPGGAANFGFADIAAADAPAAAPGDALPPSGGGGLLPAATPPNTDLAPAHNVFPL